MRQSECPPFQVSPSKLAAFDRYPTQSDPAGFRRDATTGLLMDGASDDSCAEREAWVVIEARLRANPNQRWEPVITAA